MHEQTQQHLQELVCLAQQFAAHGWVVRLELPTPAEAPAPDLGQVTVHRGGSCTHRYVLRRLARHHIQVAQQHGRRLLLLGTAQDVDDALELVRCSGGAPSTEPPRATGPARVDHRHGVPA